MKIESERLQLNAVSERQDLARKLQDVFETAIFQRPTDVRLPTNDNMSSSGSTHVNQIKSNTLPTTSTSQVKGRRMFLSMTHRSKSNAVR
jgi:hypothetical protein